MNAHPFTVSCDLCGGPGAASARTNAAAWTRGGFVYHSDPRVCRSYLDAQQEALSTTART